MNCDALVFLDSSQTPWASIKLHNEPFSLLVGRGATCDLRVDQFLPESLRSTVSRAHARISYDGNQLWLEDLNSNNLTFMDDQIVFRDTPMTLPTRVRLGSAEIGLELRKLPESEIRIPDILNESEANGLTATKTSPLSTFQREGILHQIRDSIHWATALIDIADLGGDARRADDLLAGTRAVISKHLRTDETHLRFDVPPDSILQVLEECRVPSAVTKRIMQTVDEVDVEDVQAYAAPDEGWGVWILSEPRQAFPTVHVTAARFNPSETKRGLSDEGTAVVTLAMRTVAPQFRARRELDAFKGKQRDTVDRQPSKRALTVCAKLNVYGRSDNFRYTLFKAERAAECYLREFPDGGKLPCVFVRGETGAGKSAVARVIHELSDHRSGSFERVNCASIPTGLAESELFGYEPGAHDRALTSKQGLFELSNGGVLFLDEIGKAPLDIQSKLLTVLDSGAYRRLGGTKQLRTTAYVILAASEDPEKLCNEGKMLEELWFRIGAFSITLPPLRENLDEIPFLAQKTIDNLNRVSKTKNAIGITPRAMAALQSFHWPGNVRQLIQTIEVAHALASDEKNIDLHHLPEIVRGRSRGPAAPKPDERGEIDCSVTLDTLIESTERCYIAAMIRECAGNLSEVARRSGKAYQTIHTKLYKMRDWLENGNGETFDSERRLLRRLAGDHWSVIDKS